MIYRYDVEYTFCESKRDEQFSCVKDAANFMLEKLTKSREFIGELCLWETEYANEECAKRRFHIVTTLLWGDWFHKMTDLYILAGQSQEEGSYLTRGGKVVSMAEYAKALTKRDLQELDMLIARNVTIESEE